MTFLALLKALPLKSRILIGAALVAGVFTAVSVFSSQHAAAKLAVAQSDAAAAHKAADAALASAQRAGDSIKVLQHAALIQKHESDSTLAVAVAHEQHAAAAEGAFHATAATAPDTCAAVVSAADSALVAKDSTISALHGALAHSDSAVAQATAANDSLWNTNAQLRNSLARVNVATEELVHASHPTIISRLNFLVPKPGIGAALGVDPGGTPRLVAGVTFGWAF